MHIVPSQVVEVDGAGAAMGFDDATAKMVNEMIERNTFILQYLFSVTLLVKQSVLKIMNYYLL